MKRFILLGLTVIFVLSGCGQQEQEDMPTEVPEDFQFHIKYGVMARNEINTFTNTVVKDLISAGTAELTDFHFTEAERQQIWSKVRDINLEQEKDLLANSHCRMEPHTSYDLTFQYEGVVKQFSFTNERCELTRDAAEFVELVSFIHEIVEENPAYQQLPEAVGGYE